MMVWKKTKFFFFFVFSHPGGSVSLPGVRESGRVSGRLPDDPGGFTCMCFLTSSVAKVFTKSVKVMASMGDIELRSHSYQVLRRPWEITARDNEID